MKIDRSNYEIWLIDLLDGNLSDQNEAQLHKFLSENPDLKEEYYELTDKTLIPSAKSFLHKKRLIRSLDEVPEAQFEFLSVANLENDLTPQQKDEINEIIRTDPCKKEVFEIIQKMRLSPVNVSFKGKDHLIRKTFAQRVIRLSLMGLSAAATIAVIFSLYLLTPKNLPEIKVNSAMNIPAESETSIPVKEIVPQSISEQNKTIFSDQHVEKLTASTSEYLTDITESVSVLPEMKDTTDNLFTNPGSDIKMIPVGTKIKLAGNTIRNTLIASNIPAVSQDEYEQGNSIGRFLAKNFRGIILKEPAPQDNPLKGYEIAEAGVTGINKIFGWEMALEKNKDENGELRSVYFSSKILKFSAPVKNAEPIP